MHNRRRPRRPDCGRAGRDVGGDRGQVGVGPRSERLARSGVEFVLGQLAVRERGFQRVDRLFAVGVGRPEPTAARRCRSCGPVITGTSPLAHCRSSVARLLSGGHAPREFVIGLAD